MAAEISASRCSVAVVGGGAAGLMAALSAAMTWQDKQGTACDIQSGLPERVPVILLERQDRVGRKILATGNGRCNLSNQDLSLEHYHGSDARFASGALHRFTGADTLDFFRQIGLLCRAEADGRIYPYSLQASAVLDLLRLAAERLGVRTLVSFEVKKLSPAPAAGAFRLTAADGREVQAGRVIMATGGLAAPALGCDSSGYELMTNLGHRLTDVFPALVQVRTETSLVRGLAGIKFEGNAWVSLDGKKICQSSGEVLFTEYGLSGPPLLDLSRTVGQSLHDHPDCQVMIGLDLLPEMPYDDLLQWLATRQSAGTKTELAEYQHPRQRDINRTGKQVRNHDNAGATDASKIAGQGCFQQGKYTSNHENREVDLLQRYLCGIVPKQGKGFTTKECNHNQQRSATQCDQYPLRGHYRALGKLSCSEVLGNQRVAIGNQSHEQGEGKKGGDPTTQGSSNMGCIDIGHKQAIGEHHDCKGTLRHNHR